MNSEKRISLSDVEWRIMHALWSQGDLSLGEMLKELSDAGWTKQSLTSFLKRLEAKRAIRRDTRWRPSRYSALITQDAAVKSETDELIQKVYGGNPVLMVTSAVNSGKLSEEDIRSLIDLLEKGGGEA